MAKLRKAGWKVISSPAASTKGKGTSGGVMIAAKSRIGMGYPPGDTTGTVVEGRIVAAHIDAICKGGVVFYSVYLYPSEGLTERNNLLLKDLAEHIRGHGKAWIAEGDWNNEPQVLNEAQ